MKFRLLLLTTALALAVGATSCSSTSKWLSGWLHLRSGSQAFVREGDREAAEGHTTEAILAYRQAVGQDRKDVQALRKLAAAYMAQGRTRMARRYLQQALAVRPGESDIRLAMESIPTATSGRLRLLWQSPSLDDPPNGLAVADGVIYVTSEGGEVRALSSDDGSVKWRVRLQSSVTSAPGMGGGLVFAGDQDGVLHALSRFDGHNVWAFASKGAVYATPVIDAGLVYCASSDGTLYALAADSGVVQWALVTGAPLHAAPRIADGVLYVGSGDGRLYAAGARTGAMVWERGVPTQGAVEGPPAVAGGRVLFGSGDSRVYCVAVATGGEYWRYSMPDAVFAGPVVVSDTVYVASMGQMLTALDLLSGEPRWEISTETGLRAPPAIWGNTLYYVGSSDPNLFAVDRMSGTILWGMDTGDWLASEPVIASGVIYLAGKDGSVLAYRLEDDW